MVYEKDKGEEIEILVGNSNSRTQSWISLSLLPTFFIVVVTFNRDLVFGSSSRPKMGQERLEHDKEKCREVQESPLERDGFQITFWVYQWIECLSCPDFWSHFNSTILSLVYKILIQVLLSISFLGIRGRRGIRWTVRERFWKVPKFWILVHRLWCRDI